MTNPEKPGRRTTPEARREKQMERKRATRTATGHRARARQAERSNATRPPGGPRSRRAQNVTCGACSANDLPQHNVPHDAHDKTRSRSRCPMRFARAAGGRADSSKFSRFFAQPVPRTPLQTFCVSRLRRLTSAPQPAQPARTQSQSFLGLECGRLEKRPISAPLTRRWARYKVDLDGHGSPNHNLSWNPLRPPIV